MNALTFFRSSPAVNWVVRKSDEATLQPRVDLVHTDDAVELEFELPGVRKDDIAVSVENGVLKVRAEKKSARDQDKAEYFLRERHFGVYERSFRLSEHLDGQAIEARHEDGVLKLRIARKEASIARRIEVQ